MKNTVSLVLFGILHLVTVNLATEGTWTYKADMTTARSFFSGEIVDGRIYVIGGAPSGSSVLSTVEMYDPMADTWTTKSPMQQRRAEHAACLLGDKIYAIGGIYQVPQSPILSTMEEYDTGLTAPQPDFNGDGLVNIKDLLRLIESWGQDDPLVDMAPWPFGDGTVDALDLEVLMSYWEQAVDDPTLLAHWALDETEGTVAYDSAGVNDALLIGGPIWQPEGGEVGGALVFDGIDDCVFAQYGLDPAGGPFSILAWVQGGAPGQVVISQLNGANWLQADSASGCLMTELCASGRNGGPLKSETAIGDGAWHRIGFVWDGIYRTLYVDDILAAEDTQQGLNSSISGLNIGCGTSSTAGTFWFGPIDEVRIYSRAVSP